MGFSGLREMVGYGAVLDLGNRCFSLGQRVRAQEIGAGVRVDSHFPGLYAVNLGARSICTLHASINGWICQFVVDTGAIPHLDRFASPRLRRASAAIAQIVADGIGHFRAAMLIAKFPSLRIGKYEIKSASATVLNSTIEVVGRGTDKKLRDYLARNIWGKTLPFSISIPARSISSRSRLVRHESESDFAAPSSVSVDIKAQKSNDDALPSSRCRIDGAQRFNHARHSRGRLTSNIDFKLRRFLLIQQNESRAQSSKALHRRGAREPLRPRQALDASGRWAKNPRGIDRKAWEDLRARYPQRPDAPRINRFSDVDHWLKINIERAQDLWLDRSPPLRILDLGCGPGYFLYVCKQLGHEGVGVDIDEQPLFRETTALLGVRRVIFRIEPQTPLARSRRKIRSRHRTSCLFSKNGALGNGPGRMA